MLKDLAFRMIQTDFDVAVIVNTDNEEMFSGTVAQCDEMFFSMLTPEEHASVQAEYDDYLQAYYDRYAY